MYNICFLRKQKNITAVLKYIVRGLLRMMETNSLVEPCGETVYLQRTNQTFQIGTDSHSERGIRTTRRPISPDERPPQLL